MRLRAALERILASELYGRFDEVACARARPLLVVVFGWVARNAEDIGEACGVSTSDVIKIAGLLSPAHDCSPGCSHGVVG